MPWKPAFPGEVPTLGWYVIDWMSEVLAAPDRVDYEPFQLTTEQAQFVLDLYAIDPKTGRRRYRRGVISRPKGWGKSPFLSAIACAEALADVVPSGWDAKGRPVGRPWSAFRTPWVQIAAVSEDQTRNAWAPLLEMIADGPACNLYPGLEPLGTFVNLPTGRIEFVTSAASSREGNRPVCCILDQTESWTTSNGGVKLAATMRRNLGKTGGVSIEAPNAFRPGEGSVAEESASYWARIQEGKVREAGLLFDHREAPGDTDMADKASLLDGLIYAYGDSALVPRCVIHNPPCKHPGWVDLERIVSEVWDPATDPQDARLYYLNQVTHAADSWLSQPEWAARKAVFDIVKGDAVTLGFDGSRGRRHGVTDATALIGCRVADGHLFQVEVWEQPDNDPDWQVPATAVDARVRQAFKDYNVVGFYADPSLWETYVAQWEADFGPQLVAGPKGHPIEWWFTPSKIAGALEQFHNAVIDGEMTHDNSATLTRHVLNARRRVKRQYVQIAKEHPSSSRKIDAAVAAVLAWQARLDAMAKPQATHSGVVYV